jgi:hypothetical protein
VADRTLAREAHDGATDVLRRLVAEIALTDYRDCLGQRLTLNTAYLEAAAVLEISDVIEAERKP